MNHETEVRKIVTAFNTSGFLKSRESNTVEFKLSFNAGNTATYAKTMAAFANNRGGYIVFGVNNNPRVVVGIKANSFENLNQERFTGAINSLFSPELVWECGIFTIINLAPASSVDSSEKSLSTEMYIGWIYTEVATHKPIIAQKENSGENISSGDVFYRYRAKNEKIKYAEMSRIIEDRAAKEREHLLKLFDIIRKNGTANLGIVNYGNGRFTTPYGVDFAFEQKLVAQVLKKAKFIKEGSFNETKGIPVIKVTGNIDLAEEILVPELAPDKSHPHIQKTLAGKLGISNQDLYALVWYYKLKESLKYCLVFTSPTSESRSYRFSEFALQFLKEKLAELKNNNREFDRIRTEHKVRNRKVVA